MTFIKYDNNHVLIGFDNSNNELEYTLYKAVDGGTDDIGYNQDPHDSRYDDVVTAFNSYPAMTREIEGEAIELQDD